MAYSSYNRSIPDLFSSLVGQMTTLFRQETQLARTEVSDKVSQAAMGLVMVVIGAVLLIPALVILLEAAVAALIESGVEPHWSALIVGGICLLIGIILALVGVNRLKVKNLTPTKTVEQLSQDASVAQRQMQNPPARQTTSTRNADVINRAA